MFANKSAKQAPVNEFDAIFDFSDLSADVQAHLTKVYRLLSVVIILTIIGSAIQIKFLLMTQFVVPYVLGTFVIIFSIALVPKKQFIARVALCLLFGLLQGIVLGPLIQQCIDVDPQIVRFALLITLSVFVSFSTLAMMFRHRKNIFLGSILNSFCIFLLFMWIFPSAFAYQLSLYGGLLMFIGYVFYDTQQIIQRVHRSGLDNADFVADAVTLYIDFIAIFIRILIIILKSKQRQNDGGSNRSVSALTARTVKMDL